MMPAALIHLEEHSEIQPYSKGFIYLFKHFNFGNVFIHSTRSCDCFPQADSWVPASRGSRSFAFSTNIY